MSAETETPHAEQVIEDVTNLSDAEMATQMLNVAIKRIQQKFPKVVLHVRTVSAEISFLEARSEELTQPEE